MNKDEQFKLDRLVSNCDFICKHAASDQDLVSKCEKILEFANFVDRNAYERCFLDLPVNGFLQFIGVSTSLTDLIVEEIKKIKTVDQSLRKLIDLVLSYKDLLLENYNSLADEDLVTYKRILSSEAFYNAIQ